MIIMHIIVLLSCMYVYYYTYRQLKSRQEEDSSQLSPLHLISALIYSSVAFTLAIINLCLLMCE